MNPRTVRARAGAQKELGVGRATWPRIPATCASARSLVHGGRGEGEADREGPRRREREREGARGATVRRLAERACEAEREKVHGGEATGADKLAPLGREREGDARGAETAADRWHPPVRRRGRTTWPGRAGPAGLLCLFLFLWIF
jgi:hypothetical protein